MGSNENFCSEHTEIVKIITKNSTSLSNINKEIEQIKNNHLVHIYDKLDKINYWLIGVLTTTIVGLVLTIMRYFVGKG